MTYGFSLLTAGTLLLYSAYTNSTIAEVMRGLAVRKKGPGETGFISLLSTPVKGVSEAVTPSSGGTGVPLKRGKDISKRQRQIQSDNPGLKPGITAVAAIVMARFPGLSITSGYRPGDDGHHGEGRAVDLGGSVAEMAKAAKWIARYMTKSLEEGIHNPGLSVDGHRKVPPSFWDADWEAHRDHIHLAS